MAKKKPVPQTRFAITLAGERRRFVSILEGENDRLTFTLPAEIAGAEERPGPEFPDVPELSFHIKHHKYTVQPVDDEGVYRAHHTLTKAPKESDDSYIETLAPGIGLVEPLFVMTSRFLKDGDNILPSRDWDRVIDFEVFDQNSFSLHAMFFVAPANASVALVAPSVWYKRHIVHFRQVSIIALESYSFCPSITGRVAHFMTKDRVAKYPDGSVLGMGDDSPASNGYAPDGARSYALKALSDAHEWAKRKAYQAHAGETYTEMLDLFSGLEPRARPIPTEFTAQLRSPQR